MAYWKKLKNTDAVPVLKDELVFDTTPTVNSTNPVTSDGVARAIAGASGEVPVVTENDNGKVLSAVYDAGGPAVEWAEAPSGLPDTTGASQGDVLTIGDNGPEWAEAPSGIPDMAGKNGKILGAVDNGGTMEAQWIDKPNPSAGDGIDVSAAGVISAKVGAGLTIADYSQSSHVSETVTVAGRNVIFQNYTFEYLAPCTADIINAINTSGVSFTTANNFSYSAGGVNANITGCYAAILSKTGNYAPSVANRLVLGSVAYVDTTQDPEASGTQSVKVTSGTVATFSMSDYDSAGSTITLADVLADPAGYVLALVAYDAGYTSWGICNFGLNGTATATTGTIVYDSGYSVEDAINVTNPVPAYSAGDAGKVLKVNSGATGVEWGEAGGGGGSYTAGEGISIDGSEISVSHDDTIKLAGVPQSTTSLDDLTSIYGSMMPASQYIAYKAKFDGYELSTSVGFHFKSNNSNIKMGTNRYGAGTSINGKYVKLVLANPDDRTKYVEGTVVSTATIYGSTYEANIIDSSSGIEWAAATLQSAFDWSTPDYTLADVCDSNGYTDVYIVACESDGTLITTGNVGPSGTMYVAYYGNTATASSPLVLSATTDPQGLSVTYPVPTPTTHGYVLKSMRLDPMSLGSPVVAKWEADSIPSFSSTYDKGKVLRVGDYGLSWEKNYPYGNFTSPTVDVTADLSLNCMPQTGVRYDPTSIVVSTGINFAVVTWTAISVTTPPAVTGSDYTYKACSSNPSTLTVGKTYVLTIIRDCYKIEEFG